jgi:hypothetical protein
MNENERRIEPKNEVPDDYEQLLIQCTPDTPNYLVRCKHPNGSYLDYHVNLTGRVIAGQCPVCDEPMQKASVYTCSSCAIPVVMATPHKRQTAPIIAKRITRTKIESPKHINEKAYIPRTSKEVVDVSLDDIRIKVANALGDVFESI